MYVFGNILIAIAKILSGLIFIYTWVVIISALLTFVRPDPYNPIVRTLHALTEPVYYQIRKRLPFVYAAGLDFSPLIVILILQFIDHAILPSILRFGLSLQ